jgi:hypothetical protein
MNRRDIPKNPVASHYNLPRTGGNRSGKLLLLVLMNTHTNHQMITS